VRIFVLFLNRLLDFSFTCYGIQTWEDNNLDDNDGVLSDGTWGIIQTNFWLDCLVLISMIVMWN
jgi:hypothetical protein